jgi:hypothetical protein
MSRAAEATSVNVVRARTADYHRATVLAFILCGLFTLTGLLVPPSLSQDPSQGVMEWRTLVAGGPINSIITPDPADISGHFHSARHSAWHGVYDYGWRLAAELSPGLDSGCQTLRAQSANGNACGAIHCHLSVLDDTLWHL